MEISVTTLAENTAGLGYLGEWGFSLLVEVAGKRILFDTGAGVAAAENTRRLGLDLRNIDVIVLSHGHYDHTGGLAGLLEMSGPKEIIAHPAIWDKKYAITPGEDARYIGIPQMREEIEPLGGSFTLKREPVELAPGIMTTGELPVPSGAEPVDPFLYTLDSGEMTPDTVPDDQALIVDAPYGLVVILGCAHRGVVNTLQHATAIAGREDIYAVVGGMHLMRAAAERLDYTVAALKETGVLYIGASHCTGFVASARLAAEFGDGFFLANAGSRFTLPF